MTAQDIIEVASQKLLLIGPALLIFSALACADMIVDFTVRILRRSAKEYRL